jgi:hypothetical protein
MKFFYRTRVLLLSLLFVSAGSVSKSFSQTFTARFDSITVNSRAFYEYLPIGYNPADSTTYPTIITLHGQGDLGVGNPTTLPLLLRSGIPNTISIGQFPATFTVNGQTSSFIVISPQFIYFPTPLDVDNVINYAIRHYRVDTRRIYVTGLSLGGGATWEYAGNQPAYANKIAAIVPVCGYSTPDNGRARIIAGANLPVWATHNDQDPAVPVTNTTTYVAEINAPPTPNPPAIETIFHNNIHDAWTATYTPTFKMNNLNIYQWMLQYSRPNAMKGGGGPIANAGTTQTITLPASTVFLNGAGTDVTGTITNYEWTQIGGTAATINSPMSSQTEISGMTTAGTRVFQLKVTDNKGASATNSVSVIVNGVGGNQLPVVNAGVAENVNQPASTTTLFGTSFDPDGTIVSNTWTNLSGPVTPVIVTPASDTTNITGLTATGVYTFRLTSVDNNGGTSSADVVVTVVPATGTARVINVNIYGSATYANSAWNNWNTVSSLKSGPLKYSDGIVSNISSALSAQTSYADNGANYPVTMCPQVVGRDASYSTSARADTLKGLDNSKLYDIQLYASRGNIGQTTRFTVNGTNVDIATSNNFTNIATFPNIAPKSGIIIIGLTPLATYNYLNGFTITEKTVINANQPPTANAGANQSIVSPASTVTLTGSGSDADGTVTSYAWAQTGGTAGIAAVISSPGTASTGITGLTGVGTYIFQLTVTDNQGATGAATVTITVNGVNQPPKANAGANQSIATPISSVTLTGSGADVDGTIAAYAWVQTGGPAAMISTPANASTTVTGLTAAGVYSFQLTVTDNSGATGVAGMTVTLANNIIPPGITSNKPQTISGSTVSLTSTPSTLGFAIKSTQWSKFSVPGQGMMRLTVVGSSTSAGTGASVPDSAYVNMLSAYYRSQGIIDTIYNLAVGGTWVGDIDITTALNYGAPVLLVNYPSNNFNASNRAQSIAKFQEIKDSCDRRGVQFYTTGTQPRGVSNYDSADRANLVILNDSLRIRFGDRFIDFLTPVLNTTDNSIKQEYSHGDDIHVNNAGHAAFFQLVRAANIFQHVFSSPSVISAPNAASVSVTGLGQGVNQFQVSIIDGRGLAANAVAKVTVSTVVNQPPTANAGSAQVISLPATTATLTGAGTDADGTIAGFAWVQTGGTAGVAATIVSPGLAKTNINGMTAAGTYIFQLTVTDNQGATGMSMVTITVNPAPANQPPVANAGSPQTITLPATTATLGGSGTDADGTIAGYAWTQVGGTSGVTATIDTPTLASTMVSGLTTAGTYVFHLTVTDNQGATDTSDVTITVNNATATTTRVINVNMYGTASYNNAAWNNWNVVSSLTSPVFKYSDGTASTINSVLSAQTSYSDNGPNYAVTMCPQVVGRDASYSTSLRRDTLKGLDNGKLYDIQLYASRSHAGQTTRFTVQGVNVDILTDGNFTNIASFTNVVPSNGMIVITLTPLATYDYLNGFTVIEKTAVQTTGGQNITGTILAAPLTTTDPGDQPLEVNPNPVNGQFVLQVNSPAMGKMKVQVINMSGMVNKELEFTKTETVSKVNISSGGMAPGSYILRVAVGNWTRAIQVIKL